MLNCCMHKSRMRVKDFVCTKDPLDPENFYADAGSPGRRRHGIILIDGKEYASTLQCVHCNGHFVRRKNRGDYFCLKCAGVVCGGYRCVQECTPFEKKLDLYESGKLSSL